MTQPASLQVASQMIGVCLQKNIIMKWMTVKEHLELFAALKGIPTEEIPSRVGAYGSLKFHHMQMQCPALQVPDLINS